MRFSMGDKVTCPWHGPGTYTVVDGTPRKGDIIATDDQKGDYWVILPAHVCKPAPQYLDVQVTVRCERKGDSKMVTLDEQAIGYSVREALNRYNATDLDYHKLSVV